MRLVCGLPIVSLLFASAFAAPRQHTVFLGKWRAVRTSPDAVEGREVRIRPLIIDDRAREYTSGSAHDVTDRLFVIRRAYRVNDALPQEQLAAPRWVWRLGGWISVDRVTGHVALLNLPAFDPETSEASWYRDYVAYCGASDDGAKAYLVVWQIGKRKPVLHKEFAGPGCDPPNWERGPSRVTFAAGGDKATYIVRARGADPQPEGNDEETQDFIKR